MKAKLVKESLNEIGPISYPGGEFGADEEARIEGTKDNTKYDYSIIGNIVLEKVSPGIEEEELINLIVEETFKYFDRNKANYLINIDEDYLSDTVSYVYENL